MKTFAEAALFAARAHADQRRKGAAAEPYVNHVIEVAALVVAARPGDEALAVAALLHDVVEDCGVTRETLAARFGEDVATLVVEVTDDKSLPKAERKRLQVVHAPAKSPRAKALKLADKTSNLRDLAKSPPADWPATRVRGYLDWAREVVAGLRGADPALEAAFDEAAAALEATLKERT